MKVALTYVAFVSCTLGHVLLMSWVGNELFAAYGAGAACAGVVAMAVLAIATINHFFIASNS